MEETFAWGLGNCRPAGGRPCITRSQIFVHCVFPFNANGIDAQDLVLAVVGTPRTWLQLFFAALVVFHRAFCEEGVRGHICVMREKSNTRTRIATNDLIACTRSCICCVYSCNASISICSRILLHRHLPAMNTANSSRDRTETRSEDGGEATCAVHTVSRPRHVLRNPWHRQGARAGLLIPLITRTMLSFSRNLWRTHNLLTGNSEREVLYLSAQPPTTELLHTPHARACLRYFLVLNSSSCGWQTVRVRTCTT